MAYVPDPTDTTQPTDSVIAETAAAEFRALKAFIAAGAGSSMPSFLAYGTDAQVQLVQNWMRESAVSVESYKKVADGTNYSPAINRALAAADNIFFPRRDYTGAVIGRVLLTSIAISGNKNLYGPFSSRSGGGASLTVDPTLVGPAFLAITNEYGSWSMQHFEVDGGNGDYFIENHRGQSYFAFIHMEGTTGYNGSGIMQAATGGGGNFGAWGCAMYQIKWVAPATPTAYRGFQIAMTGGNGASIVDCVTIRGQIGINVDLCETLNIQNLNSNVHITGTYASGVATDCAAIRLSGAGVKRNITIGGAGFLEACTHGIYSEKHDCLLIQGQWIDGQSAGDGGIVFTNAACTTTKILSTYVKCGKAAPAAAVKIDGAVDTSVDTCHIVSDGTTSFINLNTVAYSSTVRIHNTTFSPAPTNLANNFIYEGEGGGGTNAAVLDVTATTLFALPGLGTYHVSAYNSNSGAPAALSSYAVFIHNGTNAAIRTVSNGANMTLTLAGLNVQVTQNTGSTISVDYTYTKDHN